MLENRLLRSVKHYDIQLFCCCTLVRTRPIISRLSRYVSHTGDGYYYALLLLLLFYSRQEIDHSFYWAMFAAFTLERLIYYSLKKSFKRDRPAQAIADYQSLIEPADRFSFPSGHTSAAFLFASGLSVLFPGLTVAFYLWAGCVGISRFILGVHFATDILMGALLGLGVGYSIFSWLGA